MHIRLNGWQRIGIILSVIWAIGGGIWGNTMALDEAGKLTSLQLDSCVATNRARLRLKPGESEPYDKVWTPCWELHAKNFMHHADGHWYAAAGVGLVPIPIAWLIVYGLVVLGRWIRRGFKTK